MTKQRFRIEQIAPDMPDVWAATELFHWSLAAQAILEADVDHALFEAAYDAVGWESYYGRLRGTPFYDWAAEGGGLLSFGGHARAGEDRFHSRIGDLATKEEDWLEEHAEFNQVLHDIHVETAEQMIDYLVEHGQVSQQERAPRREATTYPMTKGSVPICPKDKFPKVRIGSRWECVAEYLDRCIGGELVVDLVQRDQTVYQVFESGHELPMLCFCCGMPLEYPDLGGYRRDRVGRRLESMSVEPVETTDGQEVLQFCLELSKKGPLSQPLAVPLSIEAAAQMKHPPHCSRARAARAPSRRRKKRQQKKRRKKRRR
jgi:hypothetical protein